MTEAENPKAKEQEAPARRLPPWLNPTLLSALAAILAAAMPITAYINGRYSIEVEREKFLAELRLKYVDRTIDKERDPVDRERLLNFLVETTEPSDPLHRWAAAELEKADEIRALREEIASSERRMSEAAVQLAELQAGRAQDRSVASSREQRLRSDLERAIEERGRLEEALGVLELRVAPGSARTATVAAGSAPKIASAEFLPGGQGSGEIRIHGNNFGQTPGRAFISPENRNAIVFGPPRSSPFVGYRWSDDLVVLPISDPRGWHGRFKIFVKLETAQGQAARFSFETSAIGAPNTGPKEDG